MTRVLFTIFGVIVYGAIVTECYYVHITQYNGYNCRGWHTTTEYNRLCMSWPNFGYEISGVEIHKGSCVKLHYELRCRGATYMISYPTRKVCDLPNWLEDHVLSVEDCDTRNVDIICPEGSYARQIQHGSAIEGITVHCYKPPDNTPIYSGNSHGRYPSNPTTSGCPIAAHGLSMWYDPNWQIFYGPSLECHRKLGAPNKRVNVTESRHKLTKPKSFLADENQDANLWETKSNKSIGIQDLCYQNWALVGVSVDIDNGGAVKRAWYWCREVTDPTSMCEPQEMMGLVLHCDNSESGNEMECSYARTVGVGVSKTITETERKEKTFYEEFGFSIGGGIGGLSLSMSATLGFSQLVGYEWSQSDTTTWTEETTVTATLKVGPHSHSKLEQLIGKCSFYGTSTSYFKQTDVNVKTGETTIKYFSV